MLKVFDLKDKGQTKQYIFRVFGFSVFSLCTGYGIGWIRIFGIDVH